MTKQHLIDIIKRAAWTAAQTAVGGIGTATLIEQVPWSAVASMTALATLLSVLKSLGATPPETDLAERVDDLTGDQQHRSAVDLVTLIRADAPADQIQAAAANLGAVLRV